jgi:hypothetical protein
MRPLRTSLIVTSVIALTLLGVACALVAHRYDGPFPGFLVYRSGAVSSLWRAGWSGQQAGLRARSTACRCTAASRSRRRWPTGTIARR